MLGILSLPNKDVRDTFTPQQDVGDTLRENTTSMQFLLRDMREGCEGHEVALPLSEAKRIAEAIAKPEASPTRSVARGTPNNLKN